MAAGLSGGPFFWNFGELDVMTVQLDQARGSPWVRAGLVVLALLLCLLGIAAWRMGWVGDSLMTEAATLPEPPAEPGAHGPSPAGSAALGATVEPAAPAPALEARPGEVLAHELMAEYRATRGAADARYQGKRLKVRGRVASVEQGESGVTLVSLQAEQDLRPLRALMAAATAAGEHLSPALKDGSVLVLDCQHQGIVMGEPVLSDCVIDRP